MLALMASPASADWLERGVIAASVADFVATEQMLARCPSCYEANPLGGSTGKRLALKAASGALVVVVNRKIAKKHPRAAKVLAGLLIGAYAGAAVHNMRLGRR